MSVVFDEKWLAEYCARTGATPPEGRKREAPKRSKYGSEKAEAGGRVFDSRHEAECFGRLELEKKAGEHRAVLCQVAFELPGGIKYIADFVTLEPDGTYRVWDAKSAATARDKVYRLKKRLMRECMGLEIAEI